MRQKQAMNSLTASQSVNGASRTVRVGESLRLVNGRAFKPTEWKKSGLPIVRIQNLNNPDAPFNYYEGQLPEKFLLDDGDLLFAWSGTPGTSFGAHIWRRGRAWLNQHIFKVHFDDKQFDKRYLQLAINRNLEQYIRAAHGGAGLAHITKGRFEESTLPCLPLDEQQRIVAEIEKQFTRLDAGMASLKRVQIALKRYRASVLKAACEGRLVPIEAELARKENHSYETGEELLRRILEERRKKTDEYTAHAREEWQKICPVTITDHALIGAALERWRPRLVILDGEVRDTGEGRSANSMVVPAARYSPGASACAGSPTGR